MNQLFNEYGQKVGCNFLMTLHPSLITKLERLSEQIGQGVVSEDQRLILTIGEMLRRFERRFIRVILRSLKGMQFR